MAVWSGHIAPALHSWGRDGTYTVSINVRNGCQERKFVFHNLRNLMRKFMFSFLFFPPLNKLVTGQHLTVEVQAKIATSFANLQH